MIAEAQKVHPAQAANFVVADTPPRQTDYVLASGIFNVKEVFDCAQGESYVKMTLDMRHAYSIKGFAIS